MKPSKMTPDEALASILQVFMALEERRASGAYPACACEPYVSVFTFHRWRALGRIVRKGEKSLRISTWVPKGGKKNGLEDKSESEREEIGRVRLRPTTAFLFCKCQTDSIE